MSVRVDSRAGLFGVGFGFESGEAVGGAFDAGAGVFEDMGIDHCCTDVGVTEEFFESCGCLFPLGAGESRRSVGACGSLPFWGYAPA